MRLENGIKNITTAYAVQIIQLIFGIFLPRLIILKFGSDVNGLTTTIINIINMINLIQAGAVGASIVAMYKPVANKDYQTCSNILKSSRFYYFKISIIFFSIILLISPLVSFSKMDDSFRFAEIEVAIIIMGINGLLELLFFSWYDILFSSFQKLYYYYTGQLIYLLIYYSCTFFVLFSKKAHFLLLYVAILIGNIAKLICLSIIYYKTIHQKLPKPTMNNYPIPNRYTLLMQQVSLQGTNAFLPVFLSYKFGLAFVSIFSIYNMIVHILTHAIFLLRNSITVVMGNVIYTENNNKIRNIFSIIHFCVLLFGIWLMLCVSGLCIPFVKLYTRHFDVTYASTNFVYPIVLFTFILCLYSPLVILIDVYAFFKNLLKYYGIGLFLSIFVLSCIDIIFPKIVLYSPFCMYFVLTIGVYTVLAKQLDAWFPIRLVLKRSAFSVAMLFCALVLVQINLFNSNSWLEWFIKAALFSLAVAAFLLFYSLIFEKNTLSMIIAYLKKRPKEKAKSYNE